MGLTKSECNIIAAVAERFPVGMGASLFGDAQYDEWTESKKRIEDDPRCIRFG